MEFLLLQLVAIALVLHAADESLVPLSACSPGCSWPSLLTGTLLTHGQHFVHQDPSPLFSELSVRHKHAEDAFALSSRLLIKTGPSVVPRGMPFVNAN